MKRQWLKRAILSMVACGSLAGFIPGVQAADVRILPVDNAKFLQVPNSISTSKYRKPRI